MTSWTALGFWGAWLLLPVLVDGSIAAAYLWACVTGRACRLPIRPITKAPDGRWPLVTIIVPVYNSEAILGACLESIKRQSYPAASIEVLAVDNGSLDESYRVFSEQQRGEWPGALHWLSTFHQGKTWALNTGIHYARGDYVINLDSDVTLHPDAIANMVAAFEADSKLVAATGAVEIAPETNARGWRRVLQECEFQEYYFSFNVGRRFQSQASSLFTLAGAFSAFRRDALLGTFMYDVSTVGEDTFMTFELHERFPHSRIGVVTAAVCYTEPVPGLRALYAQRTRWQRGEVEVIAAHPRLARRGLFHRGLSPVRALVIDHTLGFPRIAWTFVLPALAFFGYSEATVLGALAALYAVYVVVEAMTWATSSMLVVFPSARRLWHGWWVIPLMPAYRYLLFWMRFAGTLTVLTEGHQWRTQDPVTASGLQLRAMVGTLRGRRDRGQRAA